MDGNNPSAYMDLSNQGIPAGYSILPMTEGGYVRMPGITQAQPLPTTGVPTQTLRSYHPLPTTRIPADFLRSYHPLPINREFANPIIRSILNY